MDKTYIYLVEIGNNQVYVGKTKNPEKREGDHHKTFGYQSVFTVIDHVDSLDKKEWKPLETMWIWSFISWGFEVINKNKNGGGGPSYQTEEANEKRRQSTLGKKYALGKKQPKESGMKKSKKLKNKPKPKGFGDMMREVRLGVPKPKGMGEKVSKNRDHKKAAEKQQKSVLQYDLECNFIKEWPSVKHAADGTNSNASTISKVCRGIFKKTNNFIWKYKTL
jgi:hypothetical protein